MVREFNEYEFLSRSECQWRKRDAVEHGDGWQREALKKVSRPGVEPARAEEDVNRRQFVDKGVGSGGVTPQTLDDAVEQFYCKGLVKCCVRLDKWR